MGKAKCEVCGEEPCDGLHALTAIEDGDDDDVLGPDAGPCCACCPAAEWVEDVRVASAVMDHDAIIAENVEAFDRRAPTRWPAALIALTRAAAQIRTLEQRIGALRAARPEE